LVTINYNKIHQTNAALYQNATYQDVALQEALKFA